MWTSDQPLCTVVGSLTRTFLWKQRWPWAQLFAQRIGERAWEDSFELRYFTSLKRWAFYVGSSGILQQLVESSHSGCCIEGQRYGHPDLKLSIFYTAAAKSHFSAKCQVSLNRVKYFRLLSSCSCRHACPGYVFALAGERCRKSLSVLKSGWWASETDWVKWQLARTVPDGRPWRENLTLCVFWGVFGRGLVWLVVSSVHLCLSNKVRNQ